MSDVALELLAEQCAARHRMPKSTVTHPPGVIVPDDPFMTEKLADPDYVPYCLVGRSCARVRRTSFGFQCPVCGNKMNYDLTHYDGNVSVKYNGAAPAMTVAQWNDAVAARKATRAARRGATGDAA